MFNFIFGKGVDKRITQKKSDVQKRIERFEEDRRLLDKRNKYQYYVDEIKKHVKFGIGEKEKEYLGFSITRDGIFKSHVLLGQSGSRIKINAYDLMDSFIDLPLLKAYVGVIISYEAK